MGWGILSDTLGRWCSGLLIGCRGAGSPDHYLRNFGEEKFLTLGHALKVRYATHDGGYPKWNAARTVPDFTN